MQILLSSKRMTKKENVRGFSREGKQWRRQETDKDPQRVSKREEETLSYCTNGVKSGLHIRIYNYHTTRETLQRKHISQLRSCQSFWPRTNDKLICEQDIRSLMENCNHLQISESSSDWGKVRLKSCLWSKELKLKSQ